MLNGLAESFPQKLPPTRILPLLIIEVEIDRLEIRKESP